MNQVLPQGFSSEAFAEVLKKLGRIVGSQFVFSSQTDLAPYHDPYSLDNTKFIPSAAVAPANNEEIRNILKLANENNINLWVISAGKNYSYGGAAPCKSGSIVLDLKRMNKIEVNEKMGYAVVEPGVSYFDLYEHLQKTNSSLWLDCAAPGWGSVMGNALDNGVGYTPYGDHSGYQCGMEVVLADGEILRTGMGGMSGSPAWNVYKHSFGPSLDGLFKQSNFGVVTKMGIWLMRAPEMMVSCRVSAPDEASIIQLVDTARELRLLGHIQGTVTAGNWMRTVCGRTTRQAWWKEQGAIPPEVISKIISEYKIGFWNMSFGLYGGKEVTPLHLKKVKAEFEKIPGVIFQSTTYHKGEKLNPSDGLMNGKPSLAAFATLNWMGGHGAHIEYCPVMPLEGETFYERYKLSDKIFRKYDFDCFSGIIATTERAAVNTGSIIFDKLDEKQRRKAKDLFDELLQTSKEDKLPLYRTHIDFMGDVASTFDFENGSTMRTLQKIKQALDPRGIISPGKSGIL